MSKKRETPDAKKLRAIAEAEQRRKAEIIDKYALDPTDMVLLRLRFDYPGIEHDELATMVGISRLTVTRRLNKEPFKRAWAEMNLPVTQVIDQSASKLLRQYLELADSHDEMIREKVLRTLLISAGIIRNKVELDGKNLEPLVLVMSNQTVTIQPQGGTKTLEQPKAIEIEGAKSE